MSNPSSVSEILDRVEESERANTWTRLTPEDAQWLCTQLRLALQDVQRKGDALRAAREELCIIATYLVPEMEPIGPTIGKHIRLDSIRNTRALIDAALASPEGASR